jgi:hypothetical protein
MSIHRFQRYITKNHPTAFGVQELLQDAERTLGGKVSVERLQSYLSHFIYKFAPTVTPEWMMEPLTEWVGALHNTVRALMEVPGYLTIYDVQVFMITQKKLRSCAHNLSEMALFQALDRAAPLAELATYLQLVKEVMSMFSIQQPVFSAAITAFKPTLTLLDILWACCTSCAHCQQKAMLRCARCTSVVYCNVECQKAHWGVHRSLCPSLVSSPKKTNQVTCVL